MTDLSVVPATRIPRTVDEAARSRVAGVLLAAGTSSRFGEANKLLATLDGEPLVGHAARTLLDADLDSVLVVVGYEASAVRNAVAGDGVTVVENDEFANGQATSVQTGAAAAADRNAEAAVFLPGDMPFVAPETVDTLVRAYRGGVGTALAAAHDGRRGNPVLFDRTYFEALRSVDGDVGGRSVLLESEDAALVGLPDPGVTTDIDTPTDLSRYR